MKTENNINPKKPHLEDLCFSAQDWLNSIDFLSDEIRFLKKVIGSYLNNLDEELKDRLEQVQKELSQLEFEKQSLRSEIVSYLDTLDLKIKSPEQNIHEVPITEKRHQDIQYKYHVLNKLTREFKEHLFSIIEEIYGG